MCGGGGGGYFAISIGKYEKRALNQLHFILRVLYESSDSDEGLLHM